MGLTLQQYLQSKVQSPDQYAEQRTPQDHYYLRLIVIIRFCGSVQGHMINVTCT